MNTQRSNARVDEHPREPISKSSTIPQVDVISLIARPPIILKEDNPSSSLNQAAEVRCAMIQANEEQFPVRMMCRALDVRASGYHEWKGRALVRDALIMALWARKRPRGVIVHCDRGSQYCAHGYSRLLRDNGLICSMSKKGDFIAMPSSSKLRLLAAAARVKR